MDRTDGSSNYVPNPAYGTGIYRRGIRLAGRANLVVGEVEDTHHGMRVHLEHDGQQVTELRAETPRGPTNLCAAAGDSLRRLIGTSLAVSPPALYRSALPNSHCTHLFDLAALAIAHARRGPVERRYDITIPDDREGGVDCTVARDGTIVHRWRISDQVVLSPLPLRGQHLLRGFASFALAHFSGDELEAALVFQKGFFVSRARRRLYSAATGLPIVNNVEMHGVCFAYQPERVHSAFHTDSTRDFTDAPQDVLAFLS